MRTIKTTFMALALASIFSNMVFCQLSSDDINTLNSNPISSDSILTADGVLIDIEPKVEAPIPAVDPIFVDPPVSTDSVTTANSGDFIVNVGEPIFEPMPAVAPALDLSDFNITYTDPQTGEVSAWNMTVDNQPVGIPTPTDLNAPAVENSTDSVIAQNASTGRHGCGRHGGKGKDGVEGGKHEHGFGRGHGHGKHNRDDNSENFDSYDDFEGFDFEPEEWIAFFAIIAIIITIKLVAGIYYLRQSRNMAFRRRMNDAKASLRIQRFLMIGDQNANNGHQPIYRV